MKTIGIIIAGVFVGAVLTEVFRQSKPSVLGNAEKKARDFFSSFKSAFKEGYSQQNV